MRKKPTNPTFLFLSFHFQNSLSLIRNCNYNITSAYYHPIFPVPLILLQR